MEKDRTQALQTLVGYQGRGLVREMLGISDNMLGGLLDGTDEWPPGVWERFMELWSLLESGGATLPGDPSQDEPDQQDGDESFARPEEPGMGDSSGETVLQAPEDVAKTEDWEIPNQPSVTKPAPLAHRRNDLLERRRVALWQGRDVAMIKLDQVGMKHREHVAGIGLVAQIELILIFFFHESVPQPGEAWTSGRRAQEIDKRLAILRWVEREEQKMFSGFGGLWNWLMGRRRLSGKEFYYRAIADNDNLMAFTELVRESGLNRKGDDD